jgi:hypothetical protein
VLVSQKERNHVLAASLRNRLLECLAYALLPLMLAESMTFVAVGIASAS